MVKRNIIWRYGTKDELKKLYQFIKKDSHQNATDVRNGILNQIKRIAIHPEIFSLDKYKTANDGSYRAFELYHYRISYRVTDEALHIVRIRHTAQSPLSY
jgi:plasmid stabilization system protein ParE